MNLAIEQMTKLSHKISKHAQDTLLEQLSELTSRGLLVVEAGEMVMTREMDSNEIKISQKIILKLKDQEYIEKLEKINKNLLQTINDMRKSE